MKKGGLFLLLAVGIVQMYAQDADSSLISPAEVFIGRKGTILEKRFDEVGKVGYLNVQIEYVNDLSNNDKIQCVRFDIQLANNSAGPSALLDTDEVNGLLAFLKNIRENVIKQPPADPNTDISFTDKYNFQIGCFWQKANGWILYLRTESENPATETDIYQNDIEGFEKILNLAESDIRKP